MTTELPQMQAPTVPRLRADARRNRERLLETARAAFAESGLDVPMSELARRAGVGVATLYRRFPTREDLIAAAFLQQFTECVKVADAAMDDPSPWRGFCNFIGRVCAMQIADRGFTEAYSSAFAVSSAISAERTRVFDAFARLIDRAKESGELRADFSVDDLTLIVMANGGISAGSTKTQLAASDRLVAYLLQSFRADGAAPLPAAVHLGPPVV